MKIFVNTSLDKDIIGIGLYVEDKNNNQTISQYYKTNDINEAELWGIYQASILGYGKDCIIFTNSKTAIKYIQKEYKNEAKTKEEYMQNKKCEYLSYKIRRLKTKIKYTHEYINSNELPWGNTVSNYLAQKSKEKAL